jgi:hypothetical protein
MSYGIKRRMVVESALPRAAAGLSGVAHFAVGGSAVSLGMSAEAVRHLQVAARLSGVSRRCGDGTNRGAGQEDPAR